MAEDSMPMIELVRNCEQKKQDFLREGLKFICQALMEEEVQLQNGAGLHCSLQQYFGKLAPGVIGDLL